LLSINFEKKDYFLSFFFWLDLVSTVSMIFDIGWISDLLYGTKTGSAASAA
jgi:hypothetical protein